MNTAVSAPAATSTPGDSTLSGTLALARFILRRDRVRLGVWTGSMVLFYAYFTAALDTVFADEAARQGRAAVMLTPAGIVMGGPGYGLADYSTGVAMANEGITWVVLALAIFAILHVVRHTRAEEETGRAELVRAAAVGRHAPAVAAVLTLTVVNIVIAGLSAAAMVAVGHGEIDLVDALAMTIGSGLSAMVFGAVALVASQLSVHARTAVGMSLATFALAFVVRAAGDLQELGGSPLSWLSPIAWAQQLRAFVDLRWWPMLLPVLALAALLWLSALLASRRDFDGGLLPDRGGRDEAAGWLGGPVALAWLQHRTTLLWSSLGLGLMWFASGTLLPEIDTMIGSVVQSNPVAAQVFGADPSLLSRSFLAIMILYAGLCCAAYAIAMTGRGKAEESAGRAELTLALPVSRARWLGAQLLVSGAGTLTLLAISVFAMWAGAIAVGWDAQSLAEYGTVLWTYAPAVTVFVAVTAAVYAWVPGASWISWVLLAYTFVIGMFASLFELPDWAHRLSPFDWVPAPFAESPQPAETLGLWVVVAVLIGAAFAGFRRRDLTAG